MQKLASSINQEICGQKLNLYVILWKILYFMKFCGDNYDSYENKRLFISNALWEILNRTFFQQNFKVKWRLASYHGYKKTNIKNEKNIFHR